MRRRSYAVWWNDGSGRRHAGRLELGRLHALFSGNGKGRLAVPLDQITGLEYRRGEVVIQRSCNASLRVGSLDGPGALGEWASLLAARIASA